MATNAYPSYIIALTREVGAEFDGRIYDAICSRAYIMAERGELTQDTPYSEAVTLLQAACFDENGMWNREF